MSEYMMEWLRINLDIYLIETRTGKHIRHMKAKDMQLNWSSLIQINALG